MRIINRFEGTLDRHGLPAVKRFAPVKLVDCLQRIAMRPAQQFARFQRHRRSLFHRRSALAAGHFESGYMSFVFNETAADFTATFKVFPGAGLPGRVGRQPNRCPGAFQTIKPKAATQGRFLLLANGRDLPGKCRNAVILNDQIGEHKVVLQ